MNLISTFSLLWYDQVAQTEAVKLVRPEQLLDVVHELDANEREQLTEACVRNATTYLLDLFVVGVPIDHDTPSPDEFRLLS